MPMAVLLIGAMIGTILYLTNVSLRTQGKSKQQVEVITSYGSELKILSAPLHSDGSGNGHLLFNPPLRGAVADSAAVIVYRPMGRWVFTGQFPEWMNEPGAIGSAQLEFVEA